MPAMTDPRPAPTVRRLLDDARGRIDPAEAGLLLAHALGRTRGWLFAHGSDAVEAAAAATFDALVARREAGEPVAYLCGQRGFWTLDLAVTPDTLIPRPETELLVELALARLPRGREAHVADLGTGSGAIALALASERPRARVLATDASAAALAVAHANAGRLGLGNVVPIVFSQAGSVRGIDPAKAITAVSVAGYLGYLASPPLIGYLSDLADLRLALLILAPLMLGILLIGTRHVK